VSESCSNIGQVDSQEKVRERDYSASVGIAVAIFAEARRYIYLRWNGRVYIFQKIFPFIGAIEIQHRDLSYRRVRMGLCRGCLWKL
jgi:hypothetical protein